MVLIFKLHRKEYLLVKNGVNEAISYLRKQEKVLFDDGERKRILCLTKLLLNLKI